MTRSGFLLTIAAKLTDTVKSKSKRMFSGTRRTAIARLVALIGTSVVCPVASAVQRCAEDIDKRVRRCTVGIDPRWATIVADSVDGQHMSNWCWAACVEMICRYYGYIVPQSEVVRQTWGSPANLPGTTQQIFALLNRPRIDAQGRGFRIEGTVSAANQMTMIADLGGEMPLIVGTMGHAMILAALMYEQDSSNRVAVRRAYVLDPWPGRGMRVLEAKEWHGMHFAARIRLFASEQPRQPLQSRSTTHPSDCNPRVQRCIAAPAIPDQRFDCNPRVQRCNYE